MPPSHTRGAGRGAPPRGRTPARSPLDGPQSNVHAGASRHCDNQLQGGPVNLVIAALIALVAVLTYVVLVGGPH